MSKKKFVCLSDHVKKSVGLSDHVKKNVSLSDHVKDISRSEWPCQKRKL